MKLEEFRRLEKQKLHPGFRVHFERPVVGGWLTDYIPADDEPPFADEEDAWNLVDDVASVLPRVVNIFVVRADDFHPIKGYEARTIRPHYGRTTNR